ncbi:hypothetical protein [Acetobacter persici]|uniref:hypothetical protein n=1 Tax=Acetobacter persici TaxID=1076596 RepID=UPI001177A40D|nr:hypothetical protein [Acetobacter persici]
MSGIGGSFPWTGGDLWRSPAPLQQLCCATVLALWLADGGAGNKAGAGPGPVSVGPCGGYGALPERLVARQEVSGLTRSGRPEMDPVGGGRVWKIRVLAARCAAAFGVRAAWGWAARVPGGQAKKGRPP